MRHKTKRRGLTPPLTSSFQLASLLTSGRAFLRRDVVRIRGLVHVHRPPPATTGAVAVLPVVGHQATSPAAGVHAAPPTSWVTLALYLTESAKYASSAVTRLRRSDFIEAMYALPFVFANFGIAMAAKMPMITTTIRSSISVKPLRFICCYPRWRPIHRKACTPV